jgi:transposase
LIERLAAVPRVLVWDGEGAIGRWRAGRVELTQECQAFRGTLAAKVIVLRPREPEHKGIIERAHDYLETSFLPGRSFTGPADFNTQLQRWLERVNTRRRRALGCAPTDRITADRQAMLALPPVAPATGWRSALRLPRDHYIRFDSNDYSVHPAVIGRRIEVIADLQRVKAFCDGRLVADHERMWAWHQTISDPEHVAAAKALRRERVGKLRPVPEPDVQIRCLDDYDAALGLDDRLDGGVA